MRSWTRKHSAVAAAATMACAGLLVAGQQGAFADAANGSRSDHPIEVSILAPDQGDNAGIAGRGWFVDLELDYPGGPDGLRQTGSTGLQLTGPPPHANAAPFPGSFAPGQDDRLPGLVVLASTTNATLPGFSGPGTNLAGLFNLTGVTDRSEDHTQLWDTWIVGAPIAGQNVDTTLTVAVVADRNHNGIFDDAPDVIADMNHDGIVDGLDLKALGVASNIESVHFHISA